VIAGLESYGIGCGWSLGMFFAVMLVHERRHIWQARQVRNHPDFAQ
jgi:hypothetical protein